MFPGLLGKVISGILLEGEGLTPCLLLGPGDLIIHYPLNAHCLEVGIIRSLGTTLMTGGSTVTRVSSPVFQLIVLTTRAAKLQKTHPQNVRDVENDSWQDNLKVHIQKRME